MRHIIVTGTSRGLGQTILQGLLQDGYYVSACSRSKSEFLNEATREVHNKSRFFWSACNVANADDVGSFVDEAVQRAEDATLYGLVNNAGIAGDGILATFPVKDAAQIVETNLLGTLYMSRAVLRHLLRAQTGGRIINISSIIGSRGYTGLSAYSASKAGIEGLTRSLAREVGRRGITCNSVAPGYLETEMSKSLSPGQKAQIVNRTPLHRLGTTTDVYEAVRFLLGDGAAFISGQTLFVDGGISC